MSQQTPQKQVLFPRTLTHVRAGGFLACLVLFSLFLNLMGAPKATAAATNSTINFQARLENAAGNIAPDGNYNVQFNLYNASTGGSSLWTETYQNSNSQGIAVKDGYLTADLGSITAFPGTINWNQDLWVTLNIGGTSTSASPTYDGEMNPRLHLTSVPYAFRAGQLAQFNSGNGFTSVLQVLQPTSGNQTFQIPDMGAAGTYNVCIANSSACGFALSSGNNNYIQNQIASAQTSSNFWIDGTGRAATALQAPLIDAASAGTALNIGTTNANVINLNQNVVVANNKSFTAGGNALFKAATASQTAFQISSTSSTPLISVGSVTTSLVSNSSFEPNITNWSAKGTATLSQTSSQVYSGFSSLQAIVSAANSGVTTSSFTSALAANTQYELTFMASCSASIATFTYGHQDVSGTDINASTTATCDTNWRRYTFHFTTGATVTSPNIYMTLGSTASGTLWVDAVQLTQTNNSGVQPYQPGSVKIDGVLTDPLVVRNAFNSTNALEVQDTTGHSNTLVADTTNNQVIVGALNVNGSQVLTSARVLQNVTADASILTTGTVASGRLSGSYTGITAVGTLTGLTVSGVITSTVATGTAPLSVASTTVVTNLNADLLDGQHASAFATATGGAGYIQNQSSTPQSANFNIQSAAAGTATAVIQGAASQTADLLTFKDGTNATVANVYANGGINTVNGYYVNGTQIIDSSGNYVANGSIIATSVAGGSQTGTNAPGSNLTLSAGNGTGSGGSGDIIFYTAPPNGGLPAIGAYDQGTNGNTNTMTISHTVPSGTVNRLLVVEVMTASTGSSVTSMTYGGVALTQLTSISHQYNANTTEIWYLVNPAIGTANLVTNFNQYRNVVITAFNMTGVNQSTPFGTAVTAQGSTSTTASASVTATATDTVIDVMAASTAYTSMGAGQTNIYPNTLQSQYVTGSYQNGANGTVTNTYTIPSGNWTMIAVPVHSSSSGTVPNTMVDRLHITNTGLVGINNANPQYQLDVNGDINTSTQLRIGGTVMCTSSGCTPTAGSGSYIQNGTSVQSAANFNIAGNGTASILNATTGINTGSGSGTQRIDASGNLVNIGTISASGNITTGGNLIEKSVSFTPTTTGWYRIVGGGYSHGGRVVIRSTYDNAVTDVEFQYNIGGYGAGGSIQETRYSSYNSGAVSQVRISSDGAGNAYLDIYVSTATTPGPITIYGYGPGMGTFVASPVVGAVAGSSNVYTLTLGHGFRSSNSSYFAESIGGVGIGTSSNGGYKLNVQGGDANFSNTVIASALQAGSLDTASTGTLAIAGTNATTINIATNAIAHTIAIGTGAAAQNITIGSATAASTTTLQAASGSLLMDANGVTTITQSNAGNNIAVFTNSGNSRTTGINQWGDVWVDASAALYSNGLNSYNNTSLNIAGVGTGSINLLTNSASSGTVVKTNTNSTTAFQIQNSAGTAFLTADSTTQSVTTKHLFVGSPANVGLSSRLFSDGFESGDLSMWNSPGGSGTADVSTSTVRSGKYAGVLNTSANSAYVQAQIAQSTTVYGREYFNVATLGNPTVLMDLGTDSITKGNHLYIYLGASGDLCFTNGLGATAGACSTTAPSTAAWHKLETQVVVNGASGSLQVWLDGTLVSSGISVPTGDFGTLPIANFALGNNTTSTAVVYFDDLAVDSVATGDSASVYVSDSLHVSGNSSFGGIVVNGTTGNGYGLDSASTINTSGSYAVGGQEGMSSNCTNGQALNNVVVSGGIIVGGSCGNAASTLQNAYDNTSVSTGGSISTPALVQQGTYSNGSNQTTSTVNLPVASTAGNLLVAVVATSSGTPTETLSGGGTWHLAAIGAGSTTQMRVEVFYCYNCGSTSSVSVSYSTSTYGVLISVSEYSGVQTSSDPLETAAGGNGSAGSSTTQTSPSITTVNANDLILAGLSIYTSSATTASTPSGFTALTSPSPTKKYLWGDYIASAPAGTYSATWTLTGTSTIGGVATVAFKAAKSGGGANASILLADAKDYVITAPDTATDPNVLVNLQCRTGCSTSQGRWAVQSNGIDALSVLYDPSTSITNVRLQTGVDLKLAADSVGNARGAITHDFICTSTEQVNDIVVVSASGTVARTSTAANYSVVGVVVAKPNTTTCTVAVNGVVQVWGGTNTVTIGNSVQTSATAGAAKSDVNAPGGPNSIGIALSTKDASNLYWIVLR